MQTQVFSITLACGLGFRIESKKRKAHTLQDEGPPHSPQISVVQARLSPDGFRGFGTSQESVKHTPDFRSCSSQTSCTRNSGKFVHTQMPGLSRILIQKAWARFRVFAEQAPGGVRSWGSLAYPLSSGSPSEPTACSRQGASRPSRSPASALLARPPFMTLVLDSSSRAHTRLSAPWSPQNRLGKNQGGAERGLGVISLFPTPSALQRSKWSVDQSNGNGESPLGDV